MEEKTGRTIGIYPELKRPGFFVHVRTFRDDELDRRFYSPEGELQAYIELGVDCLFSDFLDTAIKALRKGE